MKLDLKSFKHVKSDDKSTTLRHKDGHEITIAHKPLSPDFKAQLGALAKLSKQDETPSQASEQKQAMAKGGYIASGVHKQYNIEHDTPGQSLMGAAVRDKSKDFEEENRSGAKAEVHRVRSEQAAIKPNLKGLAKGGPVPTDGMNIPASETAMYADGGNTDSKVPSEPPSPQPDPTPQQKIGNVQKGAKRIEGGGVPSDSPVKTGDWSHWWADGGKVCMDEGGQVPVPATASPDTDKQYKAEQIAKGSQQGADTSVDTMWHNIKNAWAKGGEVHAKRVFMMSQHGGEGNEDQNYADGGDVENVIDYSKFKKQPPPSGGTLDYKKIKEEKKEMNRQEPPMRRKKYAEGGKSEEIPPYLKEPDAPAEEAPEVPPNLDQQLYQQVYDKAKGTAQSVNDSWVGKVFPTPDPEIAANQEAMNAVEVKHEKEDENKLDQEKQQKQLNQINLARQNLGMPPVPGTTLPNPIEAMQPPAPQPDQNQTQPQQQPPQAPPQQNPMDQVGLLNKGYQEEIAGAQAKAKAVGPMAEEQAKAYADHVNSVQQAQGAYKIAYDALENERQNHMKDIQAGYIDPNKYWQDHSKVASGIGMILAGFNPTNNPNAATNFLKFQMEQSMKAQEMNLQAKQNLLSSNIHQFGNLRDAQDATRLMMADQLQAQINQAAAKAASPMAKAQALSAMGEINRAYAPLALQVSMRQALMGLVNHGGAPGAVDQTLNYMEAMSPGSSKEYRERYVPGFVGNGGPFASVSVPEPARNSLSAYQNVDRLINEAKGMANKPWTSMSPAERAKGQTLLGELQSQIRTAEEQGVYKESEANFMKGLLGGNPASALAKISTEPKLQEMQRIKHAEALQKAAQYGLKPAGSQQQTIERGGKQYTRQVIDGKAYMVPVK